jgi:hydrogenase nickel incorporation protein HypA/HybF
MHELSIASYLVESVVEQAEQIGAERVLAINLLIGDRAGIVDDSLRFSFELLGADTLVAGAALNIRRSPMRFRCDECHGEYIPRDGEFHCPDCTRIGQLIDDGATLQIESIEVET